MNQREVAWGYVAGGGQITVHRPPPAAPLSPIEALEQALRPALEHAPCLVEFSGGRDSSVLLAVALRLARREGLPEPIAITHRFRGLEETDEDQWQELVIAHVGATEWEKLAITNELDLIGPGAQSSLRRYGVVWPPTAHAKAALRPAGSGGSVVTGEGGDEVLGPHRFATFRSVTSRAVPLRARTVGYAGLAIAPTAVRRRVMTGMHERQLGIKWLKAEPLRSLTRVLADESASEPLDWRRALYRHLSLPSVHYGMATLDRLAADSGWTNTHPFLDIAFLDALARVGGRRGFASRTAALRELFGDFLPDQVLARPTKATFGRVIFSDHSRAFVESWDGNGIDPELVDADALRATWQAATPHAMSSALLQSCWLGTQPTGTESPPTPR